jgi:6,7-dimethyl-8-ribityllumazine synthase
MEKCNNYREIEQDVSGEGLRIGIVMSRFNVDVCEGLLSACACQLKKQGVEDGSIVLATVPGALEIPLVLRQMAMSGRFDALIALGAVIRGETYHFEVVSNESCAGISRVQLDTGVPVANAVLTTENDDQALERMSVKGREAALVAIEMANLLKKLK